MANQTRLPRNDLRCAIIGAGMSGILAAIELERAGHRDVVVYEKADRLGGTWRENTYPGIACDVPSHFYSYSFAPNPEWSHRFAPGAEIQAYFEDVARRYGVDGRIRFGREVTRCAFERGRWALALSDGATDVADVVIAAPGGKPVYLEDLADVSSAADQPESYVWMGTGPGAATRGLPPGRGGPRGHPAWPGPRTTARPARCWCSDAGAKRGRGERRAGPCRIQFCTNPPLLLPSSGARDLRGGL